MKQIRLKRNLYRYGLRDRDDLRLQKCRLDIKINSNGKVIGRVRSNNLRLRRRCVRGEKIVESRVRIAATPWMCYARRQRQPP